MPKTKSTNTPLPKSQTSKNSGLGTDPNIKSQNNSKSKTGRPVRPVRPTRGGHGPGSQGGGEKPKNFKKTLKRLLGDILQHKVLVVWLIILSIIGGGLGSQGPKYVGDATQVLFNGLITKNLPPNMTKDQLAQFLESQGQGDLVDMLNTVDLTHRGVDWTQFYILVLVVVGIYLTIFLGRYLSSLMAQKIIAKFSNSLRSRIQNKIFRLPLSYLDSHSTGDLLSRTTNDVDNIVGNMTQILGEFLTSVVMVISILVMMFVVGWHLALIALASVALSMFLLQIIAKKAQPHFNAQWKITGDLNGHIEEYFTGHSIISLFNQKRNAIKRFDDLNQELYKRSFWGQVLTGLIQPVMNLVTNLNYVILASIGAFGVINGWMSLGAVQSTIMYCRGYSQPLGQIAGMMNQLQSSLASLERVYEFLDAEDEPEDQVTEKLETEISGQVDFQGIDFSYTPDQHLIEGLSLKVAPGKTIAIVGKTGAGKTTLVNLIMRFYDVTSGDIKVDGKSIYALSRNDLRRNIGMVLQQTWLFSGTIRENLLYGVPPGHEIDSQHFDDIVKATHVDEFVRTLPEGYETVISDSNSQISEGQRQLLTICRAFMSDPEIIILDEATSSVDTRTEVLVQDAMNRFQQNRTAFIIAHRLSTVQNADIILVMENGSIVEQGSHSELLEKGGYYAQLYNSQYNR